MPLLGFLIPWLALLALCALGAVLGAVRGTALRCVAVCPALGALPLGAVCCVLLVLCCAGCLGALRAALVCCVLLGAAAAGAVCALLVHRASAAAARRALAAALTCPAWLVAFGGSLALALLLAAKQPLFNQWDEFSFWGTAAKVLWQNDALYTLVEHTNLAARSYPPALPVLGYAFTAFSSRFAPGMVYAGYGVLACAVMGCVVGLAGANRRGAALGAVTALLLPFAVDCWADNQVLTAWATAYADQMLGLVCAGALALWYALAGCRLWVRLAAVAPVVAVLGMVKDVGLPLGLVVALAAAVDVLCSGPAGLFGKKTRSAPPKDGLQPLSDNKTRPALLLQAAVAFGVLCCVAVLSYFGWAQHLAAALDQNRSETGGSAGLSTVGMLVAGCKELLGIGRTEKFTHVLRSMLLAVVTRRVTVFGSGAATVGVVGLLLALAWHLAHRRPNAPRGRARVVGFAAASFIGYGGYSFFQLLCYVYVFGDLEGKALASYPRYMGTWYIFWLLAALALVLWQLRPVCCERAGDDTAAKISDFTARGNAWLLCCAAAVCLVCGMRISPANTLLGTAGADWALQTQIQHRADQALAAAGGSAGNARQEADLSGEKVLLVSQWDNGGRWYSYDYALEPLALHRVPGDNTILPFVPEQGTDTRYQLYIPPAQLAEYLRENGITLLLVDIDDYDFRLSFGELFSDGMAGYDAGSCYVYRVQYTDANALGVRFVPCIGPNGEVLYE